jgi:tetratricopeptide (TPR) repeat protein
MAALSFMYRGPDGKYYYHENARAYLLARAREDAARYREWSARAAEFYRKRLGMKAMLAQLMGPREAKLTPDEEELYGEVIYHQLAVDDEAAFEMFEQAFQAAQSAWQLAACQSLVAGAREQAAALTGDRPLWLRYYEWRLLRAAQRWSDAAAVQREVLAQNPEGKLRAWILQELGISLKSLGHWEEAIECYKQDVEILRELDDRAGEANTLGNIGNVYYLQGRWGEARAQYEASLKMKRELGDRAGEAQTLNNIGNVYHSQGRWGEALAQYEASLKMKRELGDRAEIGRAT